MSKETISMSRELAELCLRNLNGGDNQLTGMEHGQAFRELRALLAKPAEKPPYDQRGDLQSYFGLSYASWLTLPRVLMEDMSKEWQTRASYLLNEFAEHFPNMGVANLGTTVRCCNSDGKIVKTPEWVINYRHPNREMIDLLKVKL